MRRRRVVIGLIVAALVAVAAVLFWPRGPRPCRATFESVQEGMTYEEVCATVGGPPGTYTHRMPLPFNRTSIKRYDHHWVADDAGMWVGYDKDDRVRDI